MISAGIMGIDELLKKGAIQVNLPGKTKDDVLTRLLGLLEGHTYIRDFDGVCTAVFEREAMLSTGVGEGLALPHAKTQYVDGVVAAFATTEHPIEYGAIDNKPVNMIFLMVSSDRAKSQHIKLLSRVSRLMNEEGFRSRLLEATNEDEILDLFHEGEKELV